MGLSCDEFTAVALWSWGEAVGRKELRLGRTSKAIPWQSLTFRPRVRVSAQAVSFYNRLAFYLYRNGDMAQNVATQNHVNI